MAAAAWHAVIASSNLRTCRRALPRLFSAMLSRCRSRAAFQVAIDSGDGEAGLKAAVQLGDLLRVEGDRAGALAVINLPSTLDIPAQPWQRNTALVPCSIPGCSFHREDLW
jgi:hypothetical protein